MEYEVNVQVFIRPGPKSPAFGAGSLEMRETHTITINTLSDLAGVMVKMHEFFMELAKNKGGKS